MKPAESTALPAAVVQDEQWCRELRERLADPARSAEAAAEIWHRYEGFILQRIHRQIVERFRARIDSGSVAQSVFLSAWSALQSDWDLHSRSLDRSLLALFACKVRNKVSDRLKRLTTLKRQPYWLSGEESPQPSDRAGGVGERRLEGAVVPPQDDGTMPASDPLERGQALVAPVPLARTYPATLPCDPKAADSQAPGSPREALLADFAPHIRVVVEEIFESLPEELLSLFMLWIQGASDKELSAATGLSPISVRRRKEQLKAAFQDLNDDSGIARLLKERRTRRAP